MKDKDDEDPFKKFDDFGKLKLKGSEEFDKFDKFGDLDDDD